MCGLDCVGIMMQDKTILVVEANYIQNSSATSGKEGFTLRKANSGKEALEHITYQTRSGLLDLMPPGFQG